jgi:hypothetical protein
MLLQVKIPLVNNRRLSGRQSDEGRRKDWVTDATRAENAENAETAENAERTKRGGELGLQRQDTEGYVDGQ